MNKPELFAIFNNVVQKSGLQAYLVIIKEGDDFSHI